MIVSDSSYYTNLRDFRISAGLTQTQLALRCGVSQNTISSIENLDTVPSVRLAMILAYVLNVPVDHLFVVHCWG